MNDPFDSSTRLPERLVFKPIHRRGMRPGFAATVCRNTGAGGRLAGTNAPDSTGLDRDRPGGSAHPPPKRLEAGRRNDTLFSPIE